MELFFGVPAHPFFVHAPIVLLPIAAIATIAIAARAAWRERLLVWLTGSLVIIVVMLFGAVNSGNALADVADGRAINGDITDHRSLGNQTLIISLVWLAALVVAVVLQRRSATPQSLSADAAPAPAMSPAQIVTIVGAVVAIVATVWLIRTGHSGADSHWVGVTRLIEDG